MSISKKKKKKHNKMTTKWNNGSNQSEWLMATTAYLRAHIWRCQFCHPSIDGVDLVRIFFHSVCHRLRVGILATTYTILTQVSFCTLAHLQNHFSLQLEFGSSFHFSLLELNYGWCHTLMMLLPFCCLRQRNKYKKSRKHGMITLYYVIR